MENPQNCLRKNYLHVVKTLFNKCWKKNEKILKLRKVVTVSIEPVSRRDWEVEERFDARLETGLGSKGNFFSRPSLDGIGK